jgi:kynureninase
MAFNGFVDILRAGKKPQFPSNAASAEYAAEMDSQDELKHLRNEFILPTKTSLAKTALDGTIPGRFLSGPSF